MDAQGTLYLMKALAGSTNNIFPMTFMRGYDVYLRP